MSDAEHTTENDAPDPMLLARIEIFETPFGGHRVQSYLRHGLTGPEFASVLRQLAEGFERGTIDRVVPPGK